MVFVLKFNVYGSVNLFPDAQAHLATSFYLSCCRGALEAQSVPRDKEAIAIDGILCCVVVAIIRM